MIPTEKRAAVSRGLHEAFGVTDFEEIRQLTKGLSPDLVFRIVVKGSPYLLRIVTRVTMITDPARHFATMTMAAEAGVAPRVWYANVEDGISIIDFVEPSPFPRTEALVQVPAILRRLHTVPPFPNAFHYGTAHDRFIWKFQTANLLPHDEVEEVFARYRQVCATYPRLEEDLVSSHSDLKPENIIFDGQRVWLVDWQAAFVNDRYFDLSVVANFVVTNDAEQQIYLETYFGQALDEYQLARFFLMRQVVHMFYAAVFLILASAGKPIHRSQTLPTFREFHERLWAGIDLADDDLKIVYGLIHWKQLLENVRHARFDEALRIVATRNARRESVRLLLPAAPSQGINSI